MSTKPKKKRTPVVAATTTPPPAAICEICGRDHHGDNPCCPKCHHYNALLHHREVDNDPHAVLWEMLKCRDCGYIQEEQRYRLKQKLVLWRLDNLQVVISQMFLDSRKRWQVVVMNPKTGHDVCRSTQAELDAFADKVEE